MNMRRVQLDAFLSAHLLHQLFETFHHVLSVEPVCHQNPPRQKSLNRAEQRAAVVPVPSSFKLHVAPMRCLDAWWWQHPRVVHCDHLALNLEREGLDNGIFSESCLALTHSIDHSHALGWLVARKLDHLLCLSRIRLVLALPRGNPRVQQVVKALLLLASCPDDWNVHTELHVVRVLEVIQHPRGRANLVQDFVDLHLPFFLSQRIEHLPHTVRGGGLVLVLFIQLLEGLDDGVEVDFFRPGASVLALGNVTQLLLQQLPVLLQESHHARRHHSSRLVVERDPLDRLGLPPLPALPFLLRVREEHFELQPSQQLVHPFQLILVEAFDSVHTDAKRREQID
mmetsp:Transcript_18008/g.36329  ORF Transcript_18008/g.36329 Transcript_18008/m.36329 type:complete len:340 (-) Transcript_18008:158-1177(-)